MRAWTLGTTLLAASAFASAALAQSTPPIPTVVSVTQMPVITQNPVILERDGNYSARINGRSYWAFDDTAMSQANASGQNFIDNTLSVATSLDASAGITLNRDQVDSTGVPERFIPFTAEEQNFDDTHNSSHCTAPTYCGASLALWPGPIVYNPANKQVIVPFGEIVRGGGITGFQGVGAGLAVGTIMPNGYFDLQRPIQNPGATHPTLLWGQGEQGFTDASFILGRVDGFDQNEAAGEVDD
jgi:hypothetical protein